MAISPQQLTIYLYSAHRAVIFAIAQLSCRVLCTVAGEKTAESEPNVHCGATRAGKRGSVSLSAVNTLAKRC